MSQFMTQILISTNTVQYHMSHTPHNACILALILNFLPQNYRRVAEIWMDEYKEYVYKKRPGSRNIDMGEVLMRGYDKRRDFSTLFNRQGTSVNNWSCENG